ncbi:MAG: hypothetical protein IPQ26_10650 [Elusimicrobia bacterium]|nr:hypothetical protein [Elusimicrobiota bacterium]
MSTTIDTEYKSIKNHEILLNKLGRWPSFHDSEIKSIHLERSTLKGPLLTIVFFIPSVGTNENHRGAGVDVNLVFEEAKVECIQDFNEQNAVFQIRMKQLANTTNEIEIVSSYGCEMKFTCSNISLNSTSPN